jgi:DNA processing protein
MSAPIKQLSPYDIPKGLNEIPSPPKTLFIRGKLPENVVYITVVGSRKHTSYGKRAVQNIIRGLRGAPIAIVSGLALGIDAIAHREAIAVGLVTVAIPGSGLDDSVIYPQTNRGLANDILAAGGTLLSEYAPKTRALPSMFPERNRLMAGIARGVLIVEAEEKSGSLITARLAVDYNKDIFAIPGPIDSSSSFGTNNLLKYGAIPVTSAEDILNEYNLVQASQNNNTHDTWPKEEQLLISLLSSPKTKDSLIQISGLPVDVVNITIMSLVLKGAIHDEDGMISRA